MASTSEVEHVAIVLLAAGSSQRMGGPDKLTADLDGEPLGALAARVLARMRGVRTVVIVAPPARGRELARALAAPSADHTGRPVDVRCVDGGARRQDSVAAGIAAAPDADWYLVHDAARPLVTQALAEAVLAGARASGAGAVPALPVSDTIKRVDEAERVLETLERGRLRAVQTPQAFAGAVLRRAHREIHDDVTDDASMVERLGLPVVVVAGDPANLKVTTPGDLELVRALLRERAAAAAGETTAPRTGSR